MTDLNKEREAFEEALGKHNIHNVHLCTVYDFKRKEYFPSDVCDPSEDRIVDSINLSWKMWQEKANAQAVPKHIVTLQRNGEVFNFDLLDLLRRSLKSSKVLKTRENWSHVSKMVGIGSTTSTLLCKEMNVDPGGTVFEASESGAEK